MPTRTFVLEGETKRFWDISWDGAEVEITSGKWGSRGRARQASFASASEREAFLAAEIAKAQKKGYRETGEAAPTPDVMSASAIAGKVATLRALVEGRRQPAWLPHFASGAEGVGVVRGPMTLDRDEDWPKCRYCGNELTGLFELDLARVPADHLREDSLVQLFWCEAWEETPELAVCTAEPDGGGWLARRHRRSQRREPKTPRGVSSSIVDWTRYDEVPFEPQDVIERFETAPQDVIGALLSSVGAKLEEGDEYGAFIEGLGLSPRNEHKLAGYPTFVQEYARPYRAQIFQLEQKLPLDVNFGDLGAGHLLLGPTGDIEFTWASH